MQDIFDKLAGLSPEKQKLFERMLKERGIDLADAMIPPIPRDAGAYPLSFAQQRLWFLDQLEPNTAMYNIPLVVRMRGELDVNALKQSIHEIGQRHESLRVVFQSERGEPHQVIQPESQIPVQVIDLRMHPLDDREEMARQMAQEAARRPFDLSEGPLVRTVLLRVNDHDHIVLLTMHHIISDGWSVGVLIRELSTYYRAYSQALPVEIPPLVIQYVDFAVWQRQWLAGDRLEQQLAYWKSQLHGSPALLRLPTDRPRPPVQSTRGGSLGFELPADLSHHLRLLAHQYQITPFMLLLAAFQALLARYSGQEEICVGIPVANRNRSEIEALIGFFANTLVIRSDFSGDPTITELLQAVKETVVDAQAHQDLPFEMLVDELDPERDMSYTPLFQVMFSLQAAATHTIQLPELVMEQINLDSGTAKFDLNLIMVDHPENLRGRITYNRDIFDYGTVERMMGHFHTLLAGIVAEPSQSISRLQLLTSEEREEVLHFFPAAEPYPADRTLVDWFEEQVERTPKRVALSFEDTHYTYRELNARANQLASYLRKRGVGPETLVGLLQERTDEIVIAILGVMKAGGAYVPIDPVYPAERMAFMLRDTGAPLLITQASLKERANGQEIEVLSLDESWKEVGLEPASNLGPIAGPDNLAYVIYTSGSTGRPKGVLITHANVVRLMTATEPWYHFGEADVWTLFHSVAFDFSVWELWGPLLYGGRLVVVPYWVSRSPESFYDLLITEGVTVLNQTPSAFRQLIRAAEGREKPAEMRLRWVIFGGEALELQSLQPWYNLFGDKRPQLVNMYGITETTVHVTYRPINQNDLDEGAGSMIGGSIPDLTLYILDSHGEPQPFGIPGELYVGGAGVARGYLNRPGLAAERFIPDPFGEEPGARLYKTGDLARLLPGGDIEYLGRIDFQVKIRGFRVELGEIESVLDRHEIVRESVVLVREDMPGDQRLVAYVVTPAGNGLDAGKLRTHCLRSLPDYMTPAAFVSLETLPLTNNGKVNRRALPAPDWSTTTTEVEFTPPRTPTEEIIASTYTQVLGVERIGAFDNFFDRGGHSLLATQVISRLREAFEVDLPLRILFERSTVAELATAVEDAVQEVQGLRLPPIKPIPRDQPLPLSFAQQRLWFLDQLEPNSPQYNIPDAVKVRGYLDAEALEGSLNEIVRRHEILRATFPTVDGAPQQVIASELHITLECQELSHLDPKLRAEESFRIAQTEAQRPFDLAKGPLVRTKLMRLGEDEHVFLLTMHHIVSDGWSTGILIRELATLYMAFIEEQPSPLPELTIQYPDFATWQREWLRDSQLDIQLDYWRQALAGMPTTLRLPTDRPRPELQSHTGRYHTFSLSLTLSETLKAFSRSADTTLFMALIAAYQAFLYRYTGQDDFGVGTPIANRNHPEIESLIGLFVNTLVLRADLSGNPSFRTLLTRVRENALGAYAHQDLPFEMLVDALQPNRNLSQSPLFQVMFMLNPASTSSMRSTGLEFTRMQTETGIALFDMTLILNEGAEGISGGVEYNADLFDAATVRRMMLHFQHFLEAMVANPDTSINALSILAPEERQQLLQGWKQVSIERSQQCMHDLFEAQVQRTPHAPALIAGTESLSYGELNRRANQLAHYLRDLGVEPEMLVGLSIPPSLEMLVGLLAILKAGGAYLPLDPDYPVDRLNFMVEDAGIDILVTESHLLDRFPTSQLNTTVCMDMDQDMFARQPEHNPNIAVASAHAAYVIYTSGSTGRPKGVVVTHDSVVNHNFAMAELFDLTAADKVLQFATINFDAAVEEIFPIWSRGGALVLRQQPGLIAADVLLSMIAEQGITVLDLPTAYWHQFVQILDETGQPLPESLRLVVVGGEKALPDRYEVWRQVAGDRVRWLNTYGPTEATIVATSYDPADDLTRTSGAELPIGLPLDNVTCYVLDAGLEPMPIGAPGELCIGGVAVARNYHNRPDLTATAFVPDPYSPEVGARMYRTGDFVRMKANGDIEYLGRLDDQVKVRGFRIELGEIEAVLRAHQQVQEAVVVARGGDSVDSGALRLVAYFVSRPQQVPSSSELRQHLQSRLPGYMVPALFIALDQLPLSSSGKVNRGALPDPDQSEIVSETEFVAPETAQEKALAEVWSQVLGLEQVGVHDNFFELGGDSILSIQLVSRANQAGLQLSPQDVFQHPTVQQLAAVVREGVAIQAEQGVIEGPVPLTAIQHWFFEQNFAQAHHWNQSLLFEVRQSLDLHMLRVAISALLEQHDALRMRFPFSQTGREQYNAGLDIDSPLRVIDLSDVEEAQVAEAITAQCAQIQSDCNLATGPLFRAAYFRTVHGKTDRLFVVVHHLVMDGLSWRILMEDLQNSYSQLLQGRAVSLPAKTTAFKHWAERLPDYAQSPSAKQQVEFWLDPLSMGSHPHENLFLPVDYPAGANTEALAETLTVELDQEATRALLQDVPPVYRTEINDALLTALAQAVFRWSGQVTWVELEGHGRENLFDDVDISRTVGWFTTTYPLWLDITRAYSPGEALMEVKEQLRAIPQHGITYGLVRYMGDESIAQKLRMSPEPQLSFNYLGQSDQGQASSKLFGPAPEFKGPDQNPEAHRTHLIEINGGVSSGRLNMALRYSRAQYHPDTIQRLAQHFLDALLELIAHCQNPDAGGVTPSDFGLADLDQQELDNLLGRF